MKVSGSPTSIDNCHDEKHGRQRLSQGSSRDKRPKRPVYQDGCKSSNQECETTRDSHLRGGIRAHQTQGNGCERKTSHQSRALLTVRNLRDWGGLEESTHGVGTLGKPVHHREHKHESKCPHDIGIAVACIKGETTPYCPKYNTDLSQNEILETTTSTI
jgi:hypothetical protein